MDIPVSIRLNPLKSSPLLDFEQDGQVQWNSYGSYLKERPSFTLDPLFHAGAYYVQDASAMFPGWMFRQALDILKGEDTASLNVLDLCAAPGGKSTDILTSLREAFGPSFALFSNEVIRQRSAVLCDNVARWGDPAVAVTSSDAACFAQMKGFFDIIVADVPCSGEGMFRKSENARKMWSEDNVSLCAARQKRIVADAWASLKPGGFLLYSTCTLNDEENDTNARWIAEELGGEVIKLENSVFEGPEATECGFILKPGIVRGEGQYCSLIRKEGSYSCVTTSASGEIAFFDRSGEIFALPDYLASQMSVVGKKLNVLNAGVHAFSTKGKDKIPYADLALSVIMEEDSFDRLELSREDALKFLHRDTLVLEGAPLGYIAVTYGGLPLGFVKNLGNRANNLHPMSRRILMNVQ